MLSREKKKFRHACRKDTNYLLSENHWGHGELIAPDGSSTGAADPYNFTVPTTGNYLHQFDTQNTGFDTPDVEPYRGYNPLEFHSYLYEGYRADPLTNQTAASSGFGPGSFVSTPPGSSSWGNLQGGEGGQDDQDEDVSDIQNSGITISDILIAFEILYPESPLYDQLAESGGSVEDSELWWWKNYNHIPGGAWKKSKVIFDRDYLKKVNAFEAAEILHEKLVLLRDDPGSNMSRSATRWDTNVNDWARQFGALGIAMSVGAAPKQL